MKLIPVVLGLLTLGLTPAGAEIAFNTPGSGCVPDHATIQENRALVGNANVRHAGANLQPIVLTCPIAPFASGTGDWILRMTYLDSTGMGAGAFVRARLYRMAIGGSVPVLLETANSNSSGLTGLTTLNSGFSHTFDFLANTYWVRVDLDRSTAAQDVILYSIMIMDSGPSDIRLKHGIALLGHLANGLGFYRFSYHGSDKAYVGVMAQEVEAVMPDAVVRGSDGYLRVFYDRLGLRMQAWEDWVAAGEKIPATAPPMRE